MWEMLCTKSIKTNLNIYNILKNLFFVMIKSIEADLNVNQLNIIVR